MFRTLKRLCLPNPLDSLLRKCAKRGGKRILLGWNRGLGDIALGLFAIVHRIREMVPHAEITFLTRPNLQDGFSLLHGVEVLVDSNLQRGFKKNVRRSLQEMGVDPSSFDLIIDQPSPTDWVRWQRGKLTPRLTWNPAYDDLWQSFSLSDEYIYIGVQVEVETTYGSWRNWPLPHWKDLFEKLQQWPQVRILLLGSEAKTSFSYPHVIDLRGKTTLFELLSIVKHRCRYMILPDSGILSMVYYLDQQFPLDLLTFWGDPRHGVLKQAVASPNLQLKHHPLVGEIKNLSTISTEKVIHTLFPLRPLRSCPSYKEAQMGSLDRVGAILLAGGQGSRLGMRGPKGMFMVGGKSLFQRICEKLPPKMPMAIMTSPLNHQETLTFFVKNDFFGREILFFQQEMYPFLDAKKRPLRFQAPNGNGSFFRSFVASGTAARLQEKGVDLLTVIPVENLLADPADLSLIGYARETQSDVVLKCIPRALPQESMGSLFERQGRIEIVEYINLASHTEKGLYCNTGMMAMTLSFCAQMAYQKLPVHWVKKMIPEVQQWGWKGEQFIFDVLPFGKVSALCYPRELCYAPIKTKESVQKIEGLVAKLSDSLTEAR